MEHCGATFVGAPLVLTVLLSAHIVVVPMDSAPTVLLVPWCS
jgi:hypothetical protein